MIDNVPFDAHPLEVDLPMNLRLPIWIDRLKLKQILFGYDPELDGFGDASFEYKCHANNYKAISINAGKLIDVS